jgi:hypothetical protein
MIPNFDKKKKQLLKNFNSLKTVLERLQFWDQILRIFYIEYLYNHNDYKNLREFKIGKEPGEWKEINEYILDNYLSYLEGQEIKNDLLNLKTLKSKFNKKANLIMDKGELIKSELAEIDNSFNNILLKHRADPESFQNYFDYQKKPDYSIIEPHLITIIRIANGQTLAEYKLHLKKLLNKYIKPHHDDHILNSLNLPQIAILLKYSGQLNAMKGKTIEKARLISRELNIGEKGIYDAIRYVDLPINKSKYNFETVINYLKQIKVKFPIIVLETELENCKT